MFSYQYVELHILNYGSIVFSQLSLLMSIWVVSNLLLHRNISSSQIITSRQEGRKEEAWKLEWGRLSVIQRPWALTEEGMSKSGWVAVTRQINHLPLESCLPTALIFYFKRLPILTTTKKSTNTAFSLVGQDSMRTLDIRGGLCDVDSDTGISLNAEKELNPDS